MAFDRRNDRDVVAEHTEVADAECSGPDQGYGGGRCRRFETDGEEDDVAVRVVEGHLERVQRGVHESDVCAAGLGLDEVALRPGHPHHVAERREDDAGLFGQPHRVVYPAHRDDAHRASGPVYQFDRLREEMLDSVAVDGVGVAATHLHEFVVVIAGELGDGLDQGASCRRVPEFVDEPHALNLFPVKRFQRR